MEIIVVRKPLERPSPDQPGEEIWHGTTDFGRDSYLPASILAALFDVGRWYRLSDFVEDWNPAAINSEHDEVTEVRVRVLSIEATNGRSNRTKPNLASIRVKSSTAAASVISEVVSAVALLELDMNSLWIRIE